MVTGRKSARGVTLVETLIAMSVLVIAIIGMITMSLKVKSFNEDQNDKRDALKACQEIMELILNVETTNAVDWQTDWTRRFYVTPMAEAEKTGTHKTQHLLLVSTIRDVSTSVEVHSAPGTPPVTTPAPAGKLFEVTVRIQQAGGNPANPQYTNNAMDVSLISRRSFAP